MLNTKVFKVSYGNVVIAVILYTLFFHLPICFNRMDLGIHFNKEHDITSIASVEVVIALFLTLLLFFLLSLSRYLYSILIPFFFCLGGASDFYIMNFGKTFDIGVLQDMLSIEWDLILEYINMRLAFAVISSLVFGILLVRLRSIRIYHALNMFFLGTLVTMVISAFYYDYKKYDFYISRVITQSYMPFSVFYNIGLYHKKYGVFKKKAEAKQDISKLFKFTLREKNKEPQIVVMVIGESMRGDMFYPNGQTTFQNSPNLMQVKNLISFKDAASSSTSTRVSIPYMLTRAQPDNFEQATSETSIISVFKSLGFKTAWIGAQGAFASYDYTYGPIIMEADKIITKSDIRKDSGQDNVYDEYLLLYLDDFIKNHPNQNLFIVLHMLGSHWNFENRYPEKFKKFYPACDSDSPSGCSSEQLLNSYHNTVYYSDWVLHEFIKRFEDRNAFLLFSSDHGYSLFENGYFGNAYEGKTNIAEQYNIAMFAWASDKYLKTHNTNFLKLKSKNNISHDYIFHSLLGCINVESEIIEPRLNLCD